MINPNRYPDLSSAGRELAPALSQYKDRDDTLVLAIALAGVPVAHEIAKFLNRPLDLILIRRLLPGKEFLNFLGAVNVAGETILDDGIVVPASPSTPQDIFLIEAIADFGRRAQTCRRGRDPLSLDHRTILVIDCGIRSGSTMSAAARALHKTKAKSIIGAVPVSSREGYAVVAPLYDELICPQQPDEFINAGYWYADFRRPDDGKVGDLLD